MLIASPLETDLAERIAHVDPQRVSLIYRPELLPVPRYAGDHDGMPPNLEEAERARWRGLLSEADILFDFDWMEPDRLHENAPRVRWVQATSSGIGEFLTRTGLTGSGIVFTTAAGVHAVPLAEFVALALLYFTKNVPMLLRRQDEGHWQRYATRELASQRVLIVGLGRVGMQIARKCSGLGMEVWGVRRTRCDEVPDPVARVVPLPELREALPQVDALVLSCPYTPETHHLIGRDELKLLPQTAVLVNVARGAIIDEAALVEALQEGGLGGAALDVFETEPLPAESPLWSMSNVLVSPHSASTVASENERIVDLFVENLRRYLDGRPLVNRFDPNRGY